MMNTDKPIPPEILNDEFYEILKTLSSLPQIKNILEIGSSTSEGSTKAFVESISKRSDLDSVKLFCLEIRKSRFEMLKKYYQDKKFIYCENISSVTVNQFPTIQQVTHFYKTINTNLNQYPLDVVLSWLLDDLNYASEHDSKISGIDIIKAKFEIKNFDMVLIDGSEFTGESELLSVKGSKIIALDDVNTYKCYNAYQILLHTVGYKLIHHNFNLRNGYAIFSLDY